MAEKDLFGLDLNGSPSLSKRIAFGEVGSVDENMTLTQLFALILGNSDTYSKGQIDTLLAEYLSKTNLTAYVPTLATHPATKGYVDGQALSVTGQFGGSEFSAYTVDGVKTISFVFVSNTDSDQVVTFPDGGFPTRCTSLTMSRDIIDANTDGPIVTKTSFTHDRDNGVNVNITIYVTAIGY